MTSAPEDEHGIFLGNLDNGKHKKEVATMISRLILEAAGFTVEAPAVRVRNSSKARCFTARIYFNNQDNQQRAFRALTNYTSVPDGLVKSGRKLRVDIYKPNIIVALPTTINPTSLDTKEAFRDDHLNETLGATSLGITTTDVLSPGTASPEATSLGATSLGFASHGATSPGVTTPGAATPIITGPIRNGNVKPKKVYTEGEELLGTETRLLEFKKAGGNLQKCLKKHLARYVCAFLNSEGGTLMLGVEDTGCICGVQCDRKLEDATRICIDNIIQRFEPLVLPHMYQVQFVPVRNDNGIQANLKVIEISVEPDRGREDSLYETPNGEVFIKRDGSVRGPLRPKDIQEWCRLKFNNKPPVVQSETNLKNQVDNLQERLQKLESNQHEDSAKDHIKKSSSDQNGIKNHKDVKKSSSDQDSVKGDKDIKKTSSAVCTIL